MGLDAVLFHSFSFMVFFPLTLLVQYVLPAKVRYLWLLAASYFFYMCWNPAYAVLLFAITALTYLCGLLLSGAKEQRRQKCLVALGFVCCVGLLIYFKYWPFLTESINSLLAVAGLPARLPAFDVLLPVGISFYTFQALGYLVDVYRGKMAAERNFFRYALFVGFFPQLMSGPITRAPEMLPQFEKPRPFDFDQVRKGLLFMLWGLFLKLVIADRAAILVNTVYNDPLNHVGLTMVVATLFFSLQIYCDFAGYSATAIGAAQVLGFDLGINFRQPYLATSVSDFWRRWHISLSSWFRDYLYIPLGGSRRSRWRKYLNIMITFLVSGLWHGANWSYLIWGGLNGLAQVLGDCRRQLSSHICKSKWAAPLLSASKEKPFSARLLSTLATFFIINLTWVFFRAPSAEAALLILRRSVIVFNPWIFVDGSLFRLGIGQGEFGMLMLAVALLVLVDVLHERGFSFRTQLLKQQLWFRWLVYLSMLFAVLLLGMYGPSTDAATFIYAQF